MNLPPKDYTYQENLIADCLSDLGFRYEQQSEFPPYTPDFYIPELKMIVEADGKFGHLKKRDLERDLKLSEQEDIDYILHIKALSKEAVRKQILEGLEVFNG